MPDGSAGVGVGAPIVTREVHPGGADGALLSARKIAEQILLDRNDYRVRAWATQVLKAAGNPKGDIAKAQAILDEFRHKTTYVPDPVNTEFLAATKYTLCLDENGVCIPGPDCDDSVIAVGSALLTIGLFVRIVLQAYDRSGVPTHVLLGIRTPQGLVKIDPTTDRPVGDAPHAVQEWVFDPFEVDALALSGKGDYVGLGLPDRPPQGLGDVQEDVRQTVLFTLQDAYRTITHAVLQLEAAIDEVTRAQALVNPGVAFDPEPAGPPITSVADFPAAPIWTESMAAVAGSLLSIGKTLNNAASDALQGTRKIFVGSDTREFYLEARDTDPFRFHAIAQAAKDTVYGVFNAAGQVLGGFLSRDGKTLTQTEAQAQVNAVGGKTPQGVGAGPLVIVAIGAGAIVALAQIAALSIAAIAAYYAIAKICDTATTKAKEATNQKLVDGVLGGKLTPQQAKELADEFSRARVEEQKAAAAAAAADPFGKTIGKIGDTLTTIAIVGAVIGGIVLLVPLVREAADSLRSRRTRRERDEG